MSEREAYGMPKHKIIDGHSYEYTEPTSSKADAQKRAGWLRAIGWKVRIVHQKFHGYDKYHLYSRSS